MPLIQDDEECIEEEPPPPPAKEEAEDNAEIDIEEEGEEEEEDAAKESPIIDMPAMDLDLGLDVGNADEEMEEEMEEILVKEVVPKKRTCTKKVTIPPIWVPNNHRTHAALIYKYFHNQTTAFLPPDPVPEPPHVIMAFDVYKKKDLISHADSHRDDVPLYGFFTSEDPDEAQFIANSAAKYKPVTP